MHHNQFSKRPVAGIVSKASFSRPVYPGETLFLDSTIESLSDDSVAYHSEGLVGDEKVFHIESALGPMMPMDSLISEHDARQQFEEIYHPGEFTVTETNHSNVITSDIQPSIQFQYDQILSVEPGVSIKALKRVTRAAPWFPDHFPNKPVLPLTVLIESTMNLAREFLKYSEFGQVAFEPIEIRRVKMNEFVTPGDEVVTLLKVKQYDDETLVLSGRCEVRGKRVCVLEIYLARRER